MVAGRGVAPRYRELMRLPWFSTFPRFERKMVDRHGFAPCSPACKAGDLLNDRAAQVESGTASRCCPEPAEFWRLCCAKLAPAVCMKIGAVSRICTGIP